MKTIFDDYEFSYQLWRAMGASAYGGADIGECLSTASRIKAGDFESWHREWLSTAEKVHAVADKALSEGHLVSAREAYLRASSYYRTAEFFLHSDPKDPRILLTWRKSRICFRRALGSLPHPAYMVNISYENTTLPGYFFKPDNSSKPRPTVILNTGFDGTAEELYFSQGQAAIQRGYNCLAFEGPGQGSVIREQGIPFRPDWEKVVTPVISYLRSRSDVDPAKIALMGLSMGGYLAPRAAAYDKRIAACIANGGVYYLDFTRGTAMTRDAMDALYDHPDRFDERTRAEMETDTSMKRSIEHGMYVFGVKTPHEFMLRSRDYTLEECADLIECPTLVVDSENEHAFRGQARMLYDALKCQKEFMLFTDEEGAGEHCQAGASRLSNQRIFDWLDGQFARQHKSERLDL